MKVIIWGHKNNGHTHSYIHYGYYKAFKHMGYETYWFDDIDPKSLNLDFSDTLFLTEGQVDKNIPIEKSSIYILHHCINDNYNAVRNLNLGNYQKFCEDGVSPNHKENTVEKIKDLCFFDSVSNTLYQTWATDLLPHEISLDDALLYNDGNRDINFVGYVWNENEHLIDRFKKACLEKNKRFISNFNVSNEEHRDLIRKSYVAPDFRGDWHVECGYIPCRIFKNISYGVPTGTNSYHVHKLFSEFVAYNSDPYNLLESCIEMYSKMSIDKIKDAMSFVKSNHTYINRVDNILKLLGIKN